MKTVFTLLAILFLSFSMSASVHGTVFDGYGVWMEGTITNPSGATSYLGQTHADQTLIDPAFGVGNVYSYINPITGQTGLYAGSEAPLLAGPGTYVYVASHYADTFTFYPGITKSVHINIELGISYEFISPPPGTPGSKAGAAGFGVLLNAGGAKSKLLNFAHSEDHTGTWDVPPGSLSWGYDLGQYLVWYCGRPDTLFGYGDQVSLAFEYYVWAQDGAIVNSLHTGGVKFSLSDEDKAAGAYLIVTSTEGFYQTDGTVPVPIPVPATMLLFGSGLAGLAGWRRFRKN